MGSGPSRNLDYSSNAISNILKDSDENVFEVNFDDLFLTSDFHSDLLELPEDKRNTTVSPPNENIVADIMTDPTAFASVQTSEEAWIEVLAPLFTGNVRTKPYIHQLYAAMFRFFNDRPNKFFENEENRQLGIMENLNTEKPLINRHYNQYESPKISINHDFINSINSFQSITNQPKLKMITSIPDFNKIQKMSSNPYYTPVSTKLKEILNNYFQNENINTHKADIEQMIMYLINWGFFSSDISCIIEALIAIFKLQLVLPSQAKFSYPVQHYYELISNSITLTNSANYLLPNPRSVVIPNYSLPKNPSCSLVACDGSKIYIIGNHGVIHSVSLNKGVINTATRFHTIQLGMIPKKERVMMGITVSNGFAHISGPFMPKPYIFKLPSFEQVKDGFTITSESKISRKSKLNPPFTSDGQFIYSLSVKKHTVSVYLIQPPKIKLQRVVKLGEKDPSNFNSNLPGSFINIDEDKIPQIPKNKNIPIFTNGTVLTIVLLSKEVNGQFYYIMRHYSLIDGTHIGDNLHIQKWPLFSILYDPWNRFYWELSPEKNKTHLIKLPNYSSQPLWLNGWLTNVSQQSYIEILNSINTSKNLKGLYTSLNSFITFLSAQFNGCSFKNYLCSHLSTTHFIAPCTPELVKSVISAIQYYADILDKCNSNNKFIKKIEPIIDMNTIRTIMLSYVGILNYNLSNFESRVVKDQTIQLTQEDINEIVDFIDIIVKNDHLSFLHRSITFLFSNSFSIIMKEPSVKMTNIFNKLYLTMPHNLVKYMLSIIDNNTMFPYLVSSKIVRDLFTPILKDIALANQVPNETEFICSFMRLMMLELKKVYTNNQVDIPPSAQMLSDTFLAFANLMSEETVFFLKKMAISYHEETFKFHPFARLLLKWLIMLEPFTQFNRLSNKFTAYLNVFFNSYSQNLLQIKASPELRPDGKGYSTIYMIYYEIFSEYLDFLAALLNGGTELKEATQYLWLIKSTIDGHVVPSDIDSLVENVKNNDTSKVKKSKKEMLSRGFSFNINKKNLMEKKLVVDFVSNLTLKKESLSAKSLMDYLYKKVNNPLNRRLTEEQRWIERLILGAFSKQLGVASDLFNISQQVAKQEVPVLSPFIKQILESIYKIRRNLTLSRQKTAQFRARCEQDMTPPVTDKLEENYEEFMNQIIKKSVFLLHIQPCLQFQSVKFEEDFPLMLKNLTFFTTSTITVENYFKLITASNKSRKNIATGIQLIIDFLRTNKNVYCNSFLIDKFSSSGDIVNYLSTLEISSREKGIKLIVQLMEILRQFIINDDKASEGSSNSIVVLYANLILSIAKISTKDVFKPLSNLLEDLSKKHSGEVFRSYLSFLGSVMTILYETNSEFASSSEFLSLIRKLFPSQEITENMLPIARICYKAGLDLQINYMNILNILKNCSPSLYHSASTFLSEILRKTEDKIGFLFTVLQEIAISISGKNSLIMEDFPIFDEKINNNDSPVNDNKCKAVNAICSCVSELIQFVRRILISGDDINMTLIKIFDYILYTFSPEKPSSKEIFDNDIFKQFQDPIFIYAVFAILSNSIDGVHVNSILKNEEDNTIYYIDSIDQVNERYFVWKLPITKDSEVISIDFSPKCVPVSIMPFTTAMYSNYQFLIPFFLKALSKSHSKLNDILILMSFKEYSSDSKFLTEFNPKFAEEFLSNTSTIKLNNFSFIDTSNYFQILLYSHLRQKSNGFNEAQDQIPQFYAFSPYDYAVSAEITNNMINCGNDCHMFITSPISNKMKSTLKVNILNCQNFQIGAYCLSTYQSGADYLLMSCVDNQFINNDINFDTKFKNKKFNNTNESIIIKYTPQIGTFIYINEERVNINPMKPNINPISFLIVTYESASIQYSLQTEYTAVSNSSDDNKSSFKSPPPSFAPLAGKAVFIKKKTNKFDLFSKNKKKQNKDIHEIIKEKTCSLMNNEEIQVDFNSFRTRNLSMNEEQVSLVGQFDENDIIMYPETIYTKLSDKINITPQSSLCAYIPDSPILYSQVRQENSIDLQIYSGNQKNEVLQAFISNGDDRVIYSNKRDFMKFVDKFSGEIQNSNRCTIQPNSLPLINLSHYSILPPKIINHFATCYLSLIRNESISSYFIKYIATSTQIEPILELLDKVELNNTENVSLMFLLVQIVIRLFVLLEPINIRIDMSSVCPIDFNSDVLQKPPRLPNLHLYLSALQKILDYVKIDKERLNQFADEWFNVLKNQFHDGFSHSAQPNHPHAIMRTFSNKDVNDKNGIFCCTRPYSVIKENTKWIICRVGFVNSHSDVPAFKNINSYNYSANRNNYDVKDILLSCQNSLQFNFYRDAGTYVAIPYVTNNNDTLCGTFFDLIISMKNFCLFANKNIDNLKSMKIYRTKLHSFFFESLIARSPFFVKYTENIFHFLNEKMVVCGSDIFGEYVKSINLLAIYYGRDPIISSYLTEQETLYNEQALIQLKTFFPTFQSQADILQIKEYIAEQKEIHGDNFQPSFEVPSNIISNTYVAYDQNKVPVKAINNLRRFYKFNQEKTLPGYPFHFLLEDWVFFTQMVPPFEATIISTNIVKIKLLLTLPKSLQIRYIWLNKPSVENLLRFSISDEGKPSSNWNDVGVISDSHISYSFKPPGLTFYLRITIPSSDYASLGQLSNIAFILTSPFKRDDAVATSNSYACLNSKAFINDIRNLATEWQPSYSQNILDCIDYDMIKEKELDLNTILFTNYTQFMTKKAITIANDSHPLHVRLLQAKFLIILNWMISNKYIDLKQSQNRLFMPFVWKQLKINDLKRMISSHSDTEKSASLHINRKAAGDIRLNISTNLKNTIIYQMTQVYSPNSDFRVMSDRPWSVTFRDEEGIDAGGLARELVAECADDFCCPLCGLVVQTPNARNDVGDYKDCVIPIANPSHVMIQKQYETAGAMIAIAARSELVQSFNFPPLVWEFLVTGEIPSINMIFDIDEIYKNSITSLQDALKSDMSEEEFSSRFKMKFVVNDSTGKEVPLTQRGKTESVTMSNCGLYISLANNFRINEMKENLSSMRKGLWENFNFDPPPTLDAMTLEFACCGQKEITVEILKRVTEFRGIREERQAMFWRVVEEFTPAERSLLLKFSTARVNIPPQITEDTILLYIDDANSVNTCPMSSTCFHKLHLPDYTSFENAYKLIKMAIECTGTFEMG